MASISQGLVLTTAMLVSSTVLYLGFLRQKTFPLPHLPGDSSSNSKEALRSCLYSVSCFVHCFYMGFAEEKKRGGKKKKKRVKFADNVKEKTKTETETETEKKDFIGKQRKQNRASSSCRHETPEMRGMPENRIALYNGILRDRVHRLEYSC